LQRNISELEGEIHVLSLREKEFEAALRQRDEELKKKPMRKHVIERST